MPVEIKRRDPKPVLEPIERVRLMGGHSWFMATPCTSRLRVDTQILMSSNLGGSTYSVADVAAYAHGLLELCDQVEREEGR